MIFFIRASLEKALFHALFPLKKDDGWRICTNSRTIVKININYSFSLPHIDDLIDHLSGAIYFMKIDLKS